MLAKFCTILWQSARRVVARVVPSRAAIADLDEIREYSIEQFDADVADTYFLGFEEAFALLANHPKAGQAYPELGKGVRCLVHRRHRIFYYVTADIVRIIRIIHHARDAKSALN
jgi:toxin ParE1/3/4